MTPQEQIALVRGNVGGNGEDDRAIAAVCDLAERALLTDDEAERIRECDFLALDDLVEAVLRRLLGEATP